MLLSLTSEGQDYLQELRNELVTKKGLEGTKAYDHVTLSMAEREGVFNTEDWLEKRTHLGYSDVGERTKDSVRRLFEGGYIDTY